MYVHIVNLETEAERTDRNEEAPRGLAPHFESLPQAPHTAPVQACQHPTVAPLSLAVLPGIPSWMRIPSTTHQDTSHRASGDRKPPQWLRASGHRRIGRSCCQACRRLDDGHSHGRVAVVPTRHSARLSWSCRESSPLITLFSDKEHAANWGLQEPWRGTKPKAVGWYLCTIKTSNAVDACVFFELSDLVNRLDLDIPERARQHSRGAFLCLHRIPRRAGTETLGPKKTRKCTIYRITDTQCHTDHQHRSRLGTGTEKD